MGLTDPILFEDNLSNSKQRLRDLGVRDNKTIDLFGDAPAVQSETSQEGARTIDSKTVSKCRFDVYNVIRAAGSDGRARFQIATQLGFEQNWIISSVDARLPPW